MCFLLLAPALLLLYCCPTALTTACQSLLQGVSQITGETPKETALDLAAQVYPDAGVAAMLAYQWQDRGFEIDSLNARRPVKAEDELLVIACPGGWLAHQATG